MKFITLLLILAQAIVWAQPQLVNPYLTANSNKNKRINQTATKLDSSTLNIPFFDNFIITDSNNTPSNNLWKSGTGVKISNTSTKQNIDFNAAIFDGTNSNNTPYNYSNPNQRGITDSLVSHKINLSGIKLSTLGKDSVLGLTYFVENGGNSEKADGRQGDYLKLLFKNVNGNWDQIWIRKDSVPSSNDTLIVDKTYKEFFDNVYKPYRFLNNFDDSLKFVKKVYPLVANYDSSSTVLKDSMKNLYKIWTGDEIFTSTTDSIDYYKLIYINDINYLNNYQSFFKNIYHKNVNYLTQQDSLDYFLKIYPNNFNPLVYYKSFYNVGPDLNSTNYGTLPLKYKEVSYIQQSEIRDIIAKYGNQTDSINKKVNELKLIYRRDSLLLYRQVMSIQKNKLYDSFTRYIYTFTSEDSIKYFHNNFRIAFVSNGRRSGSFDIWGLDRVNLRIGTIGDDNKIKDTDFGVTGTINCIFKDYFTIPRSHYSQDKVSTDSVNMILSNISKLGDSPPALNFKVSGDVLTETIVTYKSLNQTYLDFNSAKIKMDNPISIDTSRNPTIIKTQIFVSDDSPSNSRLNDTITQLTKLENSYSFDDGTAERSFQISGKYTELAYKYYTYKKDTITSIKVNFPKIIKSNDGTTIILKVWKRVSNIGDGRRNDSIYIKEKVVIEYDSLDNNGFQLFKLSSTKPIIVSDTFYVGFELTTADPIYLGYDLSGNINSAKKIKFNSSGNWETYNGNGGNLMINPVFGRFTISNTARNGENDNSNDYYFYPNPITNGQTTINGEMPVKIEVYDMRGIAVENYKLDVNTGKLETNNLPKGIYMVKITGPSIYVGKKIIVE